MFAAAIVTFTALVLVLSNFEAQTLRRIVGYKIVTDILLHATLIFLFHGTFTGLMQAEASGIMISISIRLYRMAYGFEQVEYTTTMPVERVGKFAAAAFHINRLLFTKKTNESHEVATPVAPPKKTKTKKPAAPALVAKQYLQWKQYPGHFNK